MPPAIFTILSGGIPVELDAFTDRSPSSEITRIDVVYKGFRRVAGSAPPRLPLDAGLAFYRGRVNVAYLHTAEVGLNLKTLNI